VDFLSDYDLLGAFWVTVRLTFWSAIGALVWGVVLAGMRVSPVWLMRAFATGYVTIVRNTPLTLLVIAASLGLSQTLGITLTGDTTTSAVDISNFRLAVLAFVLYTGTFVSEAVRSGINTVPVGQAEAARALGLGFFQTLRIVVMPQALRAVVAPLASVLIALTKNTTVASAIGVAEASALLKTMLENESDNGLLIFVIFAAGFVVLTLPLGLLLGWVAKKVAVKR
jgi:glutamate transport system permease protein